MKLLTALLLLTISAPAQTLEKQYLEHLTDTTRQDSTGWLNIDKFSISSGSNIMFGRGRKPIDSSRLGYDTVKLQMLCTNNSILLNSNAYSMTGYEVTETKFVPAHTESIQYGGDLAMLYVEDEYETGHVAWLYLNKKKLPPYITVWQTKPVVLKNSTGAEKIGPAKKKDPERIGTDF